MAHANAGLIGPNAIIRVAETLRERLGDDAALEVFARAKLETRLVTPPESMVPETEVGALQTALFEGLAGEDAKRISFEAGLRTGDYLLARRIPKFAQFVLKRLPPRMAARTLLSAIGKHSWTFAGSGTFEAKAGYPVLVSIANCPLCRGRHGAEPQCDFYAGTFQRLFETLVSRNTTVREIECEAMGGSACIFEIAWPKSAAQKAEHAPRSHRQRELAS
ncbi:bacteriochlorophyll 4-vinyl reductase [Rhodomicrobium lacus]|uniref:bacteriochlorophyll 4-vinyl reductase n=1 Tax=Rhodomicrobium lacus TaxID=2498452 RepID=UPI000F8C71DE|nr:bacteriochlorophyll 4-vinyl reductase [Rhodomicrobium lacus]